MWVADREADIHFNWRNSIAGEKAQRKERNKSSTGMVVNFTTMTVFINSSFTRSSSFHWRILLIIITKRHIELPWMAIQ